MQLCEQVGLILRNYTELILQVFQPVFKNCNFILKFTIILMKSFLLHADQLFASDRVRGRSMNKIYNNFGSISHYAFSFSEVLIINVLRIADGPNYF